MHRRPTAIRHPPLAQQGILLRTDHPDRASSPEHQAQSIRITIVTRTGTLLCRSRALTGMSLTGGRKASGICLPMAAWNAGDFGVNRPAIIG
jgi:hypothetical protein